jgi:hypothetical protein
MGVLDGVAILGGGGGSHTIGVLEGVGRGIMLGGGGGSHTIGPVGLQAIVPPYRTIIARMAFCKSLGSMFQGNIVTSFKKTSPPRRQGRKGSNF